MADKDGISYEWSIDAKMAGVDEGVKKLEMAVESTTKLHKATEGLSNAHEHASQSVKGHSDRWKQHKYEMEGVGQALRETRGRLYEFGEAIGAVLAFEAAEYVIDKIKELGMEILHAAANAEHLELSMKLNVGEEGMKETFEWIEKIGQDTLYTQNQLKGWSVELASAGLRGLDLKKALIAAADVGAKGGDTGAAIEAMSRAKLMGHIAGRQLVRLKVGPDDLRESLPQFKGLNDDQIRKKLEKTSLTFNQLLTAIAGKDGQLGTKAIQGADLMDAKLKNLSEIKDRYFESFKDIPAYDELKKKLGSLWDAFDPKGQSGKQISTVIGKVMTDIVHIFDGVKMEDVTKGVISALEKIPPVIAGAKDAVHWVIENFDVLKSTFDVLVLPIRIVVGAFDLLTSGIAAIITWGIQLTETISGVAFAFADTLANSLVSVLDFGSKLYSSAVDIAGNLWQGLRDGILGGISFVGDAISSLGDSMVGKLKSILGIHSPSAVFENLGEMTGEGFKIGVSNKQGQIDDVMAGAFAVPVPSGARVDNSRMGGGITVSIGDIHVTVPGGQTAPEIGQQIAQEIRVLVPAALLDALEQMNNQAGA